MQPKKSRWSQVYESSEEELLEFLDSRGLQATRTHLNAAEEIKDQTKDVTTFWCAEGSFMLRTGGDAISLQPGDALKLNANTSYEVSAGITGCAYYIS